MMQYGHESHSKRLIGQMILVALGAKTADQAVQEEMARMDPRYCVCIGCPRWDSGKCNSCPKVQDE